MLNHFSNLSCYEEFEIQCTLTGISKIDILKKIGNQIDDYYFFISEDGIFNWFDLEGNHIKDPGVLKSICKKYIPKTIVKCIIPNSVTSIGDGAFYNCKSLKEITIPNSITSIGDDVFWRCKSLTSIIIPNSVTSIGYSVFAYCESLKEITIPNSITNIGYDAFFCCKSLKEIIIPDNITSISYGAFWGCESLKEITIPDSVTHIGNGAFSYCNALEEIVFKGKSLDEVEQMENYPFGIEDENVFKCEL